MQNSLYRGRHVISAHDFDRIALSELFRTIRDIKAYTQDPRTYSAFRYLLVKDGESLFFHILSSDPSARTLASFERAIRKLGGAWAKDASRLSSVTSGETHRSLARILGPDCDCIIIRDDKNDDAAKKMADAAEDYRLKTRIINAGTGSKEHPTQMLTDLYSISERFQEPFESGKITYALVGNLSRSRAIHSLLIGLGNYGGKIYLVGPPEESIPNQLLEIVKNPLLTLHKVLNTQEIAQEVDVWYFTQLPGQNSTVTSQYTVDEALRSKMKESAIVLHPLPYGPEYQDVNDLKDPRFIHYHQTDNGTFVRMAILKTLFAPHIDLHLVRAENDTVAVTGHLTNMPVLIKEINAVCTITQCPYVRIGSDWVKLDVIIKERLFYKARVGACPHCRPL